MDGILDTVEARVLGALMEKEMATPEYYPLTLKALVAACNQKTNREPVMTLDEETVGMALESLGSKELIWEVRTDEGRVSRFEHNIKEWAELTTAQKAILCVLLLRGPQTAGELKARTARMHAFEDLDAVEAALAELMETVPEPTVVRLPLRPGHKEPRHAHLLCGEVQGDDSDTADYAPQAIRLRYEEGHVTALEQRVSALEKELEALKRRFDEFTGQFE